MFLQSMFSVVFIGNGDWLAIVKSGQLSWARQLRKRFCRYTPEFSNGLLDFCCWIERQLYYGVCLAYQYVTGLLPLIWKHTSFTVALIFAISSATALVLSRKEVSCTTSPEGFDDPVYTLLIIPRSPLFVASIFHRDVTQFNQCNNKIVRIKVIDWASDLFAFSQYLRQRKKWYFYSYV